MALFVKQVEEALNLCNEQTQMAEIDLPGTASRGSPWPESTFSSDSLFSYAPTQEHVAAVIRNHQFGDLK